MDCLGQDVENFLLWERLRSSNFGYYLADEHRQLEKTRLFLRRFS